MFKTKANNTEGKKFEIPPVGNHPAILVGIYDLGTQEANYGENKKRVRQVYLIWELTTEKQDGYKDRNHVIGKPYTFSGHKKAALRQLLEKWRGREYAEGDDVDVIAALGKACLLTVTHTKSGDNTYARVDGVGPVPKGLSVPSAQHTPFAWSLDDGMIALNNGKQEADPKFKTAPDFDWIPYLYGEHPKDWVAACDEMTGRKPSANGDAHKEEPAAAGAGADIPF